jgi:hypothetical protein
MKKLLLTTIQSGSPKDSVEAFKHLKGLLRNIDFVTFTATIVIYDQDKDKQITLSKVTLAINTEMDARWQAETHLCVKYKAQKILKFQFYDQS